jgi:hypothetical protein
MIFDNMYYSKRGYRNKVELEKSLEKILELINEVRDNNKRSVWM